MRNEVLRDVLAGCAGVLAVATVIGLPRAAEPAQQSARLPARQVMLLPYFPPRPNYCRAMPEVPSVPPQSQRMSTICR
jgi:hypothetical protein